MTKNSQPLDVLIGMELSSIEFVRDYIQFRFDGPCITAITDPFIILGNIRYNRSEENFCNLLLSFIGSPVVETLVVENEIIRIHFSDSRSINISLKPVDYVTVEAVRFDHGPDGWWVW
jgi:hypothetical protein